MEINPVGGMKRTLAATMAVATSTVMHDSGKLSDALYVRAVLLGSAISVGAMDAGDGLDALMDLLMEDTGEQTQINVG